MRIFLIDDDRLSIFLTESMLALEGFTHETKSFLSAAEALEALGSGGDDAVPDLIFLDLNMPVMDGWGFLDALAAAQLNSKIKAKCSIYILTSSLDLADTLKTERYPLVSGLIHKPIKSEEIKFIFSQHPLLDQSFTQ
ncbi:CheY-like chemotaxis protein [Pontibacter aydingkolensis]|uniref:Response regulator n=1 Tax=Pontibacter aydingkolensis TaxID=1911536 RepID=A0ABS7CX64_9BACT|nr:response regulator [Pontibacter aydingkolensis]MBW7468373.1 response regulator [Pontibacter aydingkolensis]